MAARMPGRQIFRSSHLKRSITATSFLRKRREGQSRPGAEQQQVQPATAMVSCQGRTAFRPSSVNQALQESQTSHRLETGDQICRPPAQLPQDGDQPQSAEAQQAQRQRRQIGAAHQRAAHRRQQGEDRRQHRAQGQCGGKVLTHREVPPGEEGPRPPAYPRSS